MREKRRINYITSVTTIPSFEEQVPLFHKRPTHELFNISYQEKFRLFGSGEENLGVSVNGFYNENGLGYYLTTRDFQQTANVVGPRYLWDYRTQDDYNNRMQRNIATNFDYRPAPNQMLHLRLQANDAPEPMRRRYQTRANAGNSSTAVPNATNSAIVAGAYDDRITVVRANPTAANAVPGTQPAAVLDNTSELISRNQRLRQASFAGEHSFRAFDVEWNGTWSRTRYRTLGNEGVLNMRLGGVPVIGPHGRDNRITPTATDLIDNITGPNGQTGVGWILDRRESDLYPRFLPNGGLDWTNPDNWRPTQNGLTSNAGDLQEHLVRDLKADVKYKIPLSTDWLTAFFKTGGELRDQSVLNTQFRRRWSYISRNPLPNDPSILLQSQVKTHWNVPVWEGAQYIEGGKPLNPALWEEDKYFHEQTMYTGFKYVDEKVDAGYIMTQGKFGSHGENGFLAGVRREITTTGATTYVKQRVTPTTPASTTAQQLADPVGAAFQDYGRGRTERDGSYGRNFPSIHLYRNWTPDFKTRVSWSTSFARPNMDNALPTETVNETNRTLTVGNPALLPQDAKNWDFTAEYYLRPSGSISVGWFHKTIKNYIISNAETGIIVGSGNDNGFNGQYEGLRILSSSNAGTAICEGWEFSYAQRFSFLPGALKGLSLNTNLTLLNIHGNFGTTSYFKNDQVVNVVPRTGNVILNWDWRKYSARILYNYTSQNLRSGTPGYNFANPSANNYMLPRELVNVGASYKLTPNVQLNLDIANLFNEPQIRFRGFPDQKERWLILGTKVTAGIQGQF
jgi:TonB-dependent receptor